MVQCVSVSTLTTSGNGGVYGSTALWGRHFQLMRKTQIRTGSERNFLWHHCAQRLFFAGQLVMQRQRNLRVEAGWLFKGGGDQGLDASSECSESANEDILIFFFQLDLATRVQYALNTEQYEIAQQLRDKLTEVEAEVVKQRESKRGSTSKSEAQDKALSMIRLRADLQKAIEAENYALAAELRDEINKLEAESLAASANALVYENTPYAFRLGQKVRHKVFGYSAVICGMDPVCCESSSWRESARVDKLTRGSNQPFYQFQRRICWSLMDQDQTRAGLITPIFLFYFTAWMQLEISFQSSSSGRSTIGPGMKCLVIHQTRVEKMLKAAH
ncbi:clp protease adapter protein ClpF, chloroplastic isoform X2 [Vitis riparia]|uniref:clp protease adapter protein ClpF, chloroplastic isoform X2 n=1 Tax=Vitis riparia TaxID=96939 RepID=UPI00155AF099|nr:clp protease adapter protein ClpF, chloroplastic isoform X2 [Vitis riparia]